MKNKSIGSLPAVLDGTIRAAVICAFIGFAYECFFGDNWIVSCIPFLVSLCLPAIAFISSALVPELKTGVYFVISGVAFAAVFVLLLFTDNAIMPAKEIFYGDAFSGALSMLLLVLLNCIGRSAALVLIKTKKASQQ